MTLLSDRAYIGLEGDEYEVDPTTFGFIKSSFEQAQQESGGGGNEAKACQEAAAELEIGDFVDNLTNEGGVDVDGTATTEISGDLNLPGAIDQIIKLTENPACSSQLEMAGPLPLGELEKAKDELGKSSRKPTSRSSSAKTTTSSAKSKRRRRSSPKATQRSKSTSN